MTLRIVTRGFDDVREALSDLEDEINDAERKSILESVQLVATEVKTNQIRKGGYRNIRLGGRTWRVASPPPRDDTVYSRTGMLRASIQTKTFALRDAYEGSVGTPLKYGGYVDKGTKDGPQTPHAIPGELVGGSPGSWVTVKRRGGITARHFLRKALTEKQPEIAIIFDRRLAQAIVASNMAGA